MQTQVRDHVPALTGVLTVVSLALVFGAALQLFPVGVLPRVEELIELIPHVNAVISLVAMGTISAGVVAIRRGNVRRHRALMVTSFVLFATFLALYLYRVALEGPTPFAGPPVVETVYLGILAVHILLAIVSIPLVYYALLVAATRPVTAIYETNHARVGRVAASLWLVSFLGGLVVYTLLYVVYPV